MELLEIEKALKGENRMAALKRYDDVLVALGRRVDDALKAGLVPDEYAKCDALTEAVVVARKLLRLQVKEG